MADRRRREESTPLVPPRSLGGRRESDEREDARWSGRTRTQEQSWSQEADTEQTQEWPQQSQPPAPHSHRSQSPAQSHRSQSQSHSQPQQSQQSHWTTRTPEHSHPDTRDAGPGTSDDDTQRMQPLAAAAAAVAAVKERALGPSPRPEGVSRQEDQLRAASSARPGRTRRARLRLVRVDPWSVMKTAFLLSIAFGIMCVVAVFIIWSVLTAANVFGSINESMASLLNDNFAIEDYIGMDRVLSFTMLVAVLNVVLLTAIATLGAFLYNLAASLLGGLEVTLAEDDHH
jgi:Transmembrane domain of unknown function (DUF3566)